jgi:hypothetical protein
MKIVTAWCLRAEKASRLFAPLPHLRGREQGRRGKSHNRPLDLYFFIFVNLERDFHVDGRFDDDDDKIVRKCNVPLIKLELWDWFHRDYISNCVINWEPRTKRRSFALSLAFDFHPWTVTKWVNVSHNWRTQLDGTRSHQDGCSRGVCQSIPVLPVFTGQPKQLANPGLAYRDSSPVIILPYFVFMSIWCFSMGLSVYLAPTLSSVLRVWSKHRGAFSRLYRFRKPSMKWK